MRCAAVAAVLAAVVVLSGCGPTARSTAGPTPTSDVSELAGIERDLDALTRDFDATDG